MKRELRNKARELFKNMSESEILSRSLLVKKNLCVLLSDILNIHVDDIIGSYASLKDEVRLTEFNQEQKYNLAFPCSGELGEMVYRESSYDSLSEKKVFGAKILGPSSDAKVVVPKLLLIPGRLFGLQGQRLGRGRGYYDKYLESFSGEKIGVCFDEQLDDRVPMEEFDVYMDFIVTDTKIIKVI